jgi:predicted Zn finger-like uncharacterized protein
VIVSCPHCSAVYELPMHLLGEGGAAVRCPHCAAEFAVDADGKARAAGGGGTAQTVAPAAIARGDARAGERDQARAPEAVSGTAAARAAAPQARAGAARAKEAAPRPAAARDAAPDSRAEAAPGADLHAIARRVLGELATRKGKALSDASARGRLFAEFGPDLVAAFEEYRREGGGTENAAPFRDALRERWGIDLTPPVRGG